MQQRICGIIGLASRCIGMVTIEYNQSPAILYIISKLILFRRAEKAGRPHGDISPVTQEIIGQFFHQNGVESIMLGKYGEEDALILMRRPISLDIGMSQVQCDLICRI